MPASSSPLRSPLSNNNPPEISSPGHQPPSTQATRSVKSTIKSAPTTKVDVSHKHGETSHTVSPLLPSLGLVMKILMSFFPFFLIRFRSCLPRQNERVFSENCLIAVVKSSRSEMVVARALRAAAMRVNLPPLSTVKSVASPVTRHRRPTPVMPVGLVFILPRTSLELD